MTNGKQISFLSIIIIAIVAAATSGCNEPLTSGNGCYDPTDGHYTCGGDGGVTPDSSVNPDSSVPQGAFVVVGQIDSSWGAISKVEMVSGDLATVMAASCTITSIANGWIRFTCTSATAPSDKQFLVRFTAGSSTYALVSNYRTSAPENGCWLAHGTFIDSVSVSGVAKAYDFVDRNPTVADPANDCRLDYE